MPSFSSSNSEHSFRFETAHNATSVFLSLSCAKRNSPVYATKDILFSLVNAQKRSKISSSRSGCEERIFLTHKRLTLKDALFCNVSPSIERVSGRPFNSTGRVIYPLLYVNVSPPQIYFFSFMF